MNRIIFVHLGNYMEATEAHPKYIDSTGLCQVGKLARKIFSSGILNNQPDRLAVITSSAPVAREFAIALAALIKVTNYRADDSLRIDNRYPDTEERINAAADMVVSMRVIRDVEVLVVVTHPEFLRRIPLMVYKGITQQDLRVRVPGLCPGQAMLLNIEQKSLSLFE